MVYLYQSRSPAASIFVLPGKMSRQGPPKEIVCFSCEMTGNRRKLCKFC